MNGAFLFSDDEADRAPIPFPSALRSPPPVRDRSGPAATLQSPSTGSRGSAVRTSPATSRAGTTTGLLPQRRAQPRPRRREGRISHRGRRDGDRLQGLPRPGARSARQRRSGAPLRADSARRADPHDRESRRGSRRRARPICGAVPRPAHRRSRRPVLDHGDPFVPGDNLALWSAPLWQDTPSAASRAPSRRASGPTGPAPDGL